MGTRRKARELALQVLYQIEFCNMEAGTAFDLFCQCFEVSKRAVPYARRLVDGVEERRTEINDLLSSYADNWRPERMSVVDRNILRLALFELCFDDEAPATVVINEAIEVAKRFGTEESASFINGILDAVRVAISEDAGAKDS